MKCPYCGSHNNKVVDSRLTRDGEIVRRRRECESCTRRFTTYERVEELLPMVVKHEGKREAFDRGKIVTGVQRACQKRPVVAEQIDQLVDRVERALQESGDKEVPSSVIGELVMGELFRLDDVAYVRFASVYQRFGDLNQFLAELLKIQDIKSGNEEKDS